MENFDPYHKWLGISPDEQPANHYRLLGLTLFESDRDVIDSAANRQMTYVAHCANGPHTKESQQLLNELSAVRLCLLSPAKKVEYDLQLRARMGQTESVPAAKVTARPPNPELRAKPPAKNDPAETADAGPKQSAPRKAARAVRPVSAIPLETQEALRLPPRTAKTAGGKPIRSQGGGTGSASPVVWTIGGVAVVFGLVILWGILHLFSSRPSTPASNTATGETKTVKTVKKAEPVKNPEPDKKRESVTKAEPIKEPPPVAAAVRSFKVISASYGNAGFDGKFKEAQDVTARFIALFDEGREFEVSQETFGKTEGQRALEVKIRAEGQILTLMLRDSTRVRHGRTAPSNAKVWKSGPIQVLSARWSFYSRDADPDSEDALPTMTRLLENGECRIYADQFGELQLGKSKMLTVRLQVGEQILEMKITEHSLIRIE